MGGGSDGSWRGAFGIAQHQIPSRVGQSELRRGSPSELRVWSSVVVVGPPAAKRGAGLGQGREQRLVQELIPQSTIEALDECVLHRFAWRDVVPSNSALVRPCEYGVAGEFTPIVADHHLGFAAFDDQPIQFPRQTNARE